MAESFGTGKDVFARAPVKVLHASEDCPGDRVATSSLVLAEHRSAPQQARRQLLHEALARGRALASPELGGAG